MGIHGEILHKLCSLFLYITTLLLPDLFLTYFLPCFSPPLAVPLVLFCSLSVPVFFLKKILSSLSSVFSIFLWWELNGPGEAKKLCRSKLMLLLVISQRSGDIYSTG